MKHHLHKLNQVKYISLLVVVTAILGLIWFLNRSFITITVSPVTAKLTVDNAPLIVSRKGIAKTTLAPGAHTVKVEADNFLSITKEITFKRGQKLNLKYELNEKPEIATIEAGAKLISSGYESDDIFYLDSSGTTLYKAKLSLDEKSKVIASKSC